MTGTYRQRPFRHAAQILVAAALLATPTIAQQLAPVSSGHDRAVAAGYKAALYCAGIFNAGRTPAQIDRDELRGIYPQYDAIVPTLTATIDPATATVTVPFDPALPPRRAVWSAATGCTTMPIGSTPTPVATRYATPPRPAGADPRPWPQGDAAIAPRPAAPLAAAVAAAFDATTYGKGSNTVGVVVVKDGRIVAEHYRDGFGPFVSNRTWSVGKSIAGTLIGAAQGRTAARLTPDRPAPIAQWHTPSDPRAAITLDNLLRMASGLHSDTAGNRTDAIYFGGTAVNEQATGWPLEAKPGTRFRYANNDILLAAYALRSVLPAPAYASAAPSLFARLGMRHTVAEVDWHGNYVISSQVWSTARDLARLGQFWLDDGVWQGRRVLSEGWMRYMTSATGPQPATGPGYGATLWLFGTTQGLLEGSYAAQRNRGQYVMVIPSRRLVIVRRGEDPGPARFDIARFAADVAAATR